MNTRIGVATLAVLASVSLVRCSGDDVKGGQGAGREYQVVAEGSASGVDPALASGVPPLTNTNADTTTAFSSVPGSADPTSTAMAPLPPLVGMPSQYPAGYPQPGSAPMGGYSSPPPRGDSSIQISRSSGSSRSEARPSPRPATSWPSESVARPEQPPPAPPTNTAPQPEQEPVTEDAEDAEGEQEETPPPPPSGTSTASASASAT